MKKQVSYYQVKNMNCTEFKIWTKTAGESEIISAGTNVLAHVAECNSCSQQLNLLQASIRFMTEQKSYKLSDIKTKELISKLSEVSLQSRLTGETAGYQLNRLAVAAVIIIGILTGAIAGGLLTSARDTDTSIWSNEFTLLSDNTSTNTIVFD